MDEGKARGLTRKREVSSVRYILSERRRRPHAGACPERREGICAEGGRAAALSSAAAGFLQRRTVREASEELRQELVRAVSSCG